MPKVSIIVPVYNADQVIDRCIDSILNQEFQDFELLLIDDGSKDSSPEILDRRAAEDDRIIVIHKANSGVSDTRNTGIDKAQGTFIQFLDADDWITTDSTKMLVRTAEERDADLVVGEFYRVAGEHLSRKGSIDTDRVLTRKEYAEYMKASPADYYYGVIWNKLYRRDILNRHHIRMDKTISFSEDFIFNLEYVRYCERIAPLRLPVYYYVKTEGSLVTQNMNVRRLIEMKTTVYPYYDDFFRDVLSEEEYRKERAEISAFLISGATDEFAIPYTPGTQKVGEEVLPVFSKEHTSLGGDLYYLNKLYERSLNTAALKNDLSLNDVKVFSAIRALKTADSLKAVSDLSGVTETSVIASVEALAAKRLIRFTLLPFAATISTDHGAGLLHDLDHAETDFETACFAELSEEEQNAVRKFFRNAADQVSQDRGNHQ